MKYIILVIVVFPITLFFIHAEDWTIYDYDSLLPDIKPIEISDISEDSKGNIWFSNKGYRSSVFYFSGISWKVVLPEKDGLEMSTSSLAIDNNDNIWVTPQGAIGLAKYNGKEWIIYNAYNSGAPVGGIETIYSLKIDKEGDFWIGSNEKGAVKFDGESWQLFDTTNTPLPNIRISDIEVDKQGAIWMIACSNRYLGYSDPSALVRYDKGSWTIYSRENSDFIHHFPTALAIDSLGNIWIGSEDHSPKISMFDGEKFTIFKEENSEIPREASYVMSLEVDKNNNLWAGTYGSGVIKFDDIGFNWKVYKENNSGLPENDVYSIHVDAQNRKWIGTSNAIAVLDESTPVIEEKRSDNSVKLSVSPNPAAKSVTVRYVVEAPSDISIYLTDVLGSRRQLLASEFKSPANYTETFDVSVLPPGVYYVVLRAGGAVRSEKVVVAR